MRVLTIHVHMCCSCLKHHLTSPDPCARAPLPSAAAVDPATCTGDRATLNSGKMVGHVLLGGKERNLSKFRRISAHVKQVGGVEGPWRVGVCGGQGGERHEQCTHM